MYWIYTSYMSQGDVTDKVKQKDAAMKKEAAAKYEDYRKTMIN